MVGRQARRLSSSHTVVPILLDRRLQPGQTRTGQLELERPKILACVCSTRQARALSPPNHPELNFMETKVFASSSSSNNSEFVHSRKRGLRSSLQVSFAKLSLTSHSLYGSSSFMSLEEPQQALRSKLLDRAYLLSNLHREALLISHHHHWPSK